MTMRRWLTLALFSMVALVAQPAAARAQGALVHGTVAAAVADGSPSPAFGGGVTWRFNRALGLGVELSHLRSLRSQFAHIYCCGRDEEARATTFTTNVRLEIPTLSKRVLPFVVAGGGVAAVSESYNIYYAQLANTLESARGRLGLTVLPVLPGPSDVTTTSTSMALTLGGGASILVTDRFAVDVDLRVLHIMSDQSRNIGRFGAGVSYRF